MRLSVIVFAAFVAISGAHSFCPPPCTPQFPPCLPPFFPPPSNPPTTTPPANPPQNVPSNVLILIEILRLISVIVQLNGQGGLLQINLPALLQALGILGPDGKPLINLQVGGNSTSPSASPSMLSNLGL